MEHTTYEIKGINWRTIVVNTNSIRGKATKIEWQIKCTHSDQIRITETQLGEEDEKIENLFEKREYTP